MTDPDGQTCQALKLGDGTIVNVHGADEPLSVADRDALTELAQAARDLHARRHADDPPVLAAVAEAVRAQATRRGLLGSQVADELGMSHAVVVRLMQHSDAITVGQLAKLAGWAGLDVVAVNAVCDEIERLATEPPR